MLPAEYKAGRLQAYKLICEMMTRHQDVFPNSDFLVHLYHVMHKGITSGDQVRGSRWHRMPVGHSYFYSPIDGAPVKLMGFTCFGPVSVPGNMACRRRFVMYFFLRDVTQGFWLFLGVHMFSAALLLFGIACDFAMTGLVEVHGIAILLRLRFSR